MITKAFSQAHRAEGYISSLLNNPINSSWSIKPGPLTKLR
jgi:hypothetical protein